MSSDTDESNIPSDIEEEKKWHKNYTRLMPYYYVNHKAKLVSNSDSAERLVRVRKVVKTRESLNLEIAEKDNSRKKKQKILNKEMLIVAWDDLEEINLNTLKTTEWTLQFIK